MSEWEKNLREIEKNIKNYDKSYEEYLRNKYSIYKYICVFGAGNIGLVTATELVKHGVKVHFFCDNDIKKAGMEYIGIPCFSPDKLIEIKDQTMVIVSTRHFKEIFRQLEEIGVRNIDRVFSNKYEVKEKLRKFGKDVIINNVRKTTDLLADERSRDVYTTILKNWTSLDYCQDEIDAVFTDDQYFCKDILNFSNNECFVDAGAYDGDTFQKFYEEVGTKFQGAHLFELSENNYSRLVKKIKCYDLDVQKKVYCINKGLSDVEKVIRYSDNDEGSAVDTEGLLKGYLISIDEACRSLPVTYIKMDIEGSEKAALQGAKRTIRIRKPKLAICMYHKFEDFWELPIYINELLPEYRIYIRHHTDLLNETVCYASIIG